MLRQRIKTNKTNDPENNLQISATNNNANWYKKLFTVFLIFIVVVAAISGIGLLLQRQREKKFALKVINNDLADNEFKQPITDKTVQILKDLSIQDPLESQIFMNSPFKIYLKSFFADLSKNALGQTDARINEMYLYVIDKQPDFYLALPGEDIHTYGLKTTTEHEIHHITVIMSNSDQNCNPSLFLSNLIDEDPISYYLGYKTTPMLALPKQMQSILKDYNNFDSFFKEKINPLLEKKKSNNLNSSDKELLTHLEQAVSDYEPAECMVIIDIEDSQEQKQIFENVVNGLNNTMQTNEPYSYLFEKLNYTMHIRQILQFGRYVKISGLTVKDPNDKLEALANDFNYYETKTALNKDLMQGHDEIKKNQRRANFEKDATRQSIGKSKNMFFSEAKEIHRNNMKQSKCEVVKNAVQNYEQSEKFVSDQEMAQFYQQIKSNGF